MRADSSPELWKWYRAYKKRYFSAKRYQCMPDDEHVSVYWHPCHDDYGEIQEIEPGEFEIMLNPKFATDTKISKMCLLHEMVHLYLIADSGYRHHAEPFQAQMRRLSRLNAFKNLW
jgi:hypothetical protein